MKIVAHQLYPDEPCYGLFEGPRKGRWVQAVYVIRGDAIAEFAIDYGREEDFDEVMPLIMPSFGENSVSQLQEHAEKNRHDRYWSNRRKEMLAESTLIEDAIRQRQINHELIQNRSVFGPLTNIQRNIYPRQFAQRQMKERKNGYRTRS